MGKAKIRKKIVGYEKQLKKHMEKFKEAEARGAVESMSYMADEMEEFFRRRDVLKSRLLPKKHCKKKKGNKN